MLIYLSCTKFQGLVAGREIEIVGSHGFAADDLPTLLGLVQSGKLNVYKLIEKEVSLEEGAKAIMSMDKVSPLGMTMVTDFSHGHDATPRSESSSAFLQLSRL